MQSGGGRKLGAEVGPVVGNVLETVGSETVPVGVASGNVIVPLSDWVGMVIVPVILSDTRGIDCEAVAVVPPVGIVTVPVGIVNVSVLVSDLVGSELDTVVV